MKRILLTTCALILSVFAYSQTVLEHPKIIINPSYEVNSSGIYNVSQIELSDTATRLTIHCTYVPFWFLYFTKQELTIRETETGKTSEIKSIEGGEWEKQIWMKGSGDSTIVLTYPPLDKGVKKIDFGNWVYGISLDESKAGKREPLTVKPGIAKWINESLAKVKRTAPIDFNSTKFFNKGTAKLIGCIKGYDTRLGFTTGLVYTSNELTREDYPTVVKIQPDGRFEADLPYDFPQYSTLYFKDMPIPFYLEPGQTLSMIIDWEEFLNADRMRNIRYQIKNTEYQGPLAKVNTDLAGYTPEDYNYEEFQKKMKTITPDEFKIDQMAVFKNNKQKIEDYILNNNLTPQAISIIRNKTVLENAGHLFDFVMDRRYYASQDTANKMLKMPVPLTYFDFLKDIPLNDKSLLCTSEFSNFVNRFEYCEPLSNSSKHSKYNVGNLKPQKDLFTFILEAGVEISAEDKEIGRLLNKQDKTVDENRILDTKKEQILAITEKYKDQIQAYMEKYMKPLSNTSMANSNKENWRLKDSVLRSDLGLESSLVYEITKVRSLKFIFEGSSKETAKEFWDSLKTGITTPYLIETGNQLYKESFPEKTIAAYTLPKGVATDIFKKIVDPFKGKLLFIDFWATTCGPCVAGIKSMQLNREKYKGNKDFDFIFITDERGSPEADYTKFVKEQGMKNIYRLPKDDYNYLRQLFKFNGIPHYTVIDQQGNVLSNNFAMHNFDYELPKLLPDFKNSLPK